MSATQGFMWNYVKYVPGCALHTKMLRSSMVWYDMKKRIILFLIVTLKKFSHCVLSSVVIVNLPIFTD